MNFVIIAILIYLTTNNRSNGFKNLLSSISIEDATEFLPLLGIDEQTVNLIKNLLPTFFSDSPDITSLIKSVIPLISNFSSKREVSEESFSYDGLSPLDDIAPDEIINRFIDYFE